MKLIESRLHTEENIKFELCYKLKDFDINFSLEYQSDDGLSRFDIVIIDKTWNKIIGIIECKKCNPRKIMHSKRKSEQIIRYESHGIPVFVMRGKESINKALEFAVNLFTYS